MATKRKLENASSASSWAMFKEDIPGPIRIGGKIKKDKKKETSEDDTLMGRLGKRMAARDYIDKQNLGFGTKASKAATADCGLKHQLNKDIDVASDQTKLDKLARTDRNAALNAMIEKDAKRNASTKHKELLGMGESMDYSDGNATSAASAALASGFPEKMNMSNKVLLKGIEVEKEHTKNPKVAKKIAKDHLKESKNYYKDWEDKESMLFKKDVNPKESADQGMVILGTPNPMPEKPAPGNNMAAQAKSMKNVYGPKY